MIVKKILKYTVKKILKFTESMVQGMNAASLSSSPGREARAAPTPHPYFNPFFPG
jgi:hypothetical protein